MEIRDSRRVPGPNLIWERSCAVLDVALDDSEAERFLASFSRALERIRERVGWQHEEFALRRFRGGASLASSSPIDALYSATELNEWAFAAARAELTGSSEPALESAARRFASQLARERGERPNLLAVQAECDRRGVSLFAEDRTTSVGMGTGSLAWPTQELPPPSEIDWTRVHDVPTCMITGTNGKSTTVRLVAAIGKSAGKVVGLSSTDWIQVDGELIDKGDYSGPAGARTVLRHPRVELGVLETARGGMLRRGLVLRRAGAAALLNVDEDHLGEWGVDDLSALADAKFVIASAVRHGGLLVLNADDPEVARRGDGYLGELAWFSLDPRDARLGRHVERGGTAAWLDGDALELARGGSVEVVARAGEIPITVGGAARHNVANALAAILLATRAGLSTEACARGLASFRGDPDENPGRLNLFELNGVRAIVDFAHNPHGYRAFFDMVSRLPAGRRAVLLGQAGDRDEASIRELVRIALGCEPALVVIKEMPAYLRGRQPGEVPAMIADELGRQGVGPERIAHAPTELDAAKLALAWSRPGDLLLLLAHSERRALVELVTGLCQRNWRPGESLER